MLQQMYGHFLQLKYTKVGRHADCWGFPDTTGAPCWRVLLVWWLIPSLQRAVKHSSHPTHLFLYIYRIMKWSERRWCWRSMSFILIPQFIANPLPKQPRRTVHSWTVHFHYSWSQSNEKIFPPLSYNERLNFDSSSAVLHCPIIFFFILIL